MIHPKTGSITILLALSLGLAIGTFVSIAIGGIIGIFVGVSIGGISSIIAGIIFSVVRLIGDSLEEEKVIEILFGFAIGIASIGASGAAVSLSRGATRFCENQCVTPFGRLAPLITKNKFSKIKQKIHNNKVKIHIQERDMCREAAHI